MKTNDDFYYSLNNHQRLFLVYTLAVLIDLTVINFFNEYWSLVEIESFTISLAAAILLTVLLKATLKLEHKVAEYFSKQPGRKPKIYRYVCSYLILVISKFVILEAVNFSFGDRVLFLGPFHGLVSFIVVLFSILIAEALVRRIYLSLDDTDTKIEESPA